MIQYVQCLLPGNVVHALVVELEAEVELLGLAVELPPAHAHLAILRNLDHGLMLALAAHRVYFFITAGHGRLSSIVKECDGYLEFHLLFIEAAHHVLKSDFVPSAALHCQAVRLEILEDQGEGLRLNGEETAE